MVLTAAEKAAGLRAYRKTPKGWATTAWANIVNRLRNDPDYARVELRMTRAEFVAWCIPAITKWWRENPNGRQSIDRKKASGHYDLNNIRIMDVRENSRRRKFNKNNKAPAGKAWCSGHKSYIKISLFSPAPSRPPLFVNNRCRECKRNEYHRNKS